MSMIIVLGNSYAIKDELKTRFNFKFDPENRIWWRTCLEDKYWYWEQTIESLSKDIHCCMVKDLTQVSQVKKELETLIEKPAHPLEGQIVEVKAWYARAFKQQHNTEFAYRNIKILKVHRETFKALQVDIEFFGGIATSCGCCGRPLDNAISKACGIGPICAVKIGLPRPTLESAKETLEALNKKAHSLGQFHSIWIPKSQIIGNEQEDQNEEEAV